MTMIRERPSQRLHHRLTAPLKVSANGLALRSLDWSLGGMRLDGFATPPDAGDVLSFSIAVPFQGFDIAFSVDAKAVRVAKDGQAAFQFIDLSERAEELLEFFAGELTRGSMTAVEDAIKRIDAPVTPISTKPDPNPIGETPLPRLPVGKILRYVGYAGLGVLVFGYLAFIIFMNVWKLEAPSAVVAAPISNILATASGTLVEDRIPETGVVKAGDILFMIEDPDLEEQIHRAKVMVRRAGLERDLAGQMLGRLKASLEDRKELLSKRIAGAEAALVETRARAAATASSYNRLAKLAKKGLVAKTRVDTAAAAAAADRARVAQQEEQLSLARDALASAEAGRLIDARMGDARLGSIRSAGDAVAQGLAEVSAAERRMELAEEELRGLEKQRERIAIRAPTDGRVARVVKPIGAGVKRGESIGLFEQSAERSVDVFLTQDEAAVVSRHREAEVWLPTSDRRFLARIALLDRAAGGLDAATVRYSWTDQDSRSVYLRLQPVTADGAAALAETDPGSPAAVVFDRMSTPRRFAIAVGRLFAQDRGGATLAEDAP